MIFIIGKASDWKYKDKREINTLAELLALTIEFDSNIIIEQHLEIDCSCHITIYDDYME